MAWRRKAELLRHDFKSEAELCDVLAEQARKQGWLVFPETGDQDLLLVASPEVRTRGARPGDQLGVQAKLRGNLNVLAQALPPPWGEQGPHFHAVLVPAATQDLVRVAHRCGVVVLEGTHRVWDPEIRRWRRERGANNELTYLPHWLRNYYDEVVWRPDREILVPAGVKSPKRVTPWKVKAVRLCLEGLRRGFLTSSDFRAQGVSMTVWRQKKWIEATGERIGKSMKYVLVDSSVPPHLAYPEIASQLREDEALDPDPPRKKRRKRL